MDRSVTIVIKEVIVVEGKDDTAAIKRAVEADTIETGGSAIDRGVIERVRLAQARRGVIIFTDPDHAGERIRKALSRLRTEFAGADSDIAWSDLIEAGLIHHPDAANRRLAVGNRLGIGYCNGKQFHKRCRMFAIGLAELHAALEGLDAPAELGEAEAMRGADH